MPRISHIDICPPSLQDREFVAAEDRIELRPVPYSAPAALPSWVGRRTSRPIVYLTLGTAFGTPELLTTAIEGLARLDVRVVVAAGRVRPDQLGDVPDNVTVQPWVAQADLLPHVDVVVHHGGSGTTLGALAVGAPQVILPKGADQFANADAVGAAGAGVLLLPDELSADAIAGHTQKLLPRHGHGGHRDAARAIAEEIARMPPRTRSPAVSRSTQPAGEPPGPASPLTRLLASRQGKPCRSGSGWRGGPTGSTGGWWCGCRCRRRSCPGRSFPLRAPVAVSGRGTRRR